MRSIQRLYNPATALLHPTHQLNRNLVNITSQLRGIMNRSLVANNLLGNRYLPRQDGNSERQKRDGSKTNQDPKFRGYAASIIAGLAVGLNVLESEITEEEKAKKELYQKLKSKAKDGTSEEDINKLLEAIFPFYQQHKNLHSKKVMVLFSGGLDTSFMTHILQNIIGAEIITFAANVGSVTASVNMQEIANRSREVGASNHTEIDCREYIAELAFNAINAEATLGVAGVGHHPAISLSRVAICKGAIEYARTNKIDALLHGSNGSQNNPYRFMSALNYFKKLYGVDVEELSPNIGGTTVERSSEALYLRSMGIGLKSQAFEKDVSHDRSLCGDEWEEDFLANPANQFDVREAALKNVAVPSSPLRLNVKFKEGLPVALKIGDGEFVEKKPLEMLEELNEIGLEYRVGIYDYAENRPVGINAREVHISPAMDILIKTHNWLRSYQLDRPTNIIYDQLSKHQSDIIMQQNFHQSPEREQIDAALKKVGKNINGEVGFTLEQGLITNISSLDADKFMEGKIESATKEFVRAHVEGGVDKFTKQSIGFLTEQLTLIEQKKQVSNKIGNSPRVKEAIKVSEKQDQKNPMDIGF